MQEYDLIAPFYDLEHAQYSEDLDMYQNYAEISGGRVLELACGSGRLLKPLAAQGYEITGVDSSERMLEIAQKELAQAGLQERCTLVQQDISALELGHKYRFAFIALGSFGHITARSKQQQVLRKIREHLSVGATFILDITNQDARYMEELGGQLLHLGTWKQEGNTYLTHFVSPATSSNRHLLELTHFYERYPQGGSVERTVVTTYLALFERVEIELLLEQAGFVIKDVYGDYDFSEFQLESPRMIFLAEAK